MSNVAVQKRWHLKSMTVVGQDNSEFFPLGNQPKGILQLSEDGLISAQLMKSDRLRFMEESILGGSDNEMIDAYRGFVSFWGRYTIDSEGNVLEYRVDGSLYPNWIGTQHSRRMKLEDKSLTLTTPPMLVSGREVSCVFVWSDHEG